MNGSKLIRIAIALAALTASLVVTAVGTAGSPAIKAGLSGANLVKPGQVAPGIPTFKVEAYKFYAADESDIDTYYLWDPSDEPMFVFTSAIGSGASHTVRSKEYEDVDSGEWRDMNSLCLLASCATGFSSPTTLSVQLFEMDGGSPDSVREKVERGAQLVKWGSLALTLGSNSVEVPDSFVDYLTDLFGDDLMGSTTIRLDPRVFTPKLTTVGSWMTQKVRLSGGTGDLFGIAGEADYDLYLKVIRLADRPLLNQR